MDDLTKKRAEAIELRIDAMKGPQTYGNAVIVDGRLVPDLTMVDHGELIEFCLDNRMSWEFPREIAAHVASFAANTMAIGAGFPCFHAEQKPAHFATPCSRIDETLEPSDG